MSKFWLFKVKHVLKWVKIWFWYHNRSKFVKILVFKAIYVKIFVFLGKTCVKIGQNLGFDIKIGQNLLKY